MDDLIDNNMLDDHSNAGDSFGYSPQKERFLCGVGNRTSQAAGSYPVAN
jgi:hypothetical protein